MADQTMGIDYFSLDTDVKDDDKVFDLKYRYGMPEGASDYDQAAAFCAYGRFVELLAAIYSEGFCLHVTRQTRLRLSQRLGMGVSELGEFLDACADCGLFDADVWKERGVLTSRGIQRRYFHAAKRRKGGIPSGLHAYIYPEFCEVLGIECPQDVRTVHASCEHDVDTMRAPQRQSKGKDRKVKERTEKEKPPKGGKEKERHKHGEYGNVLLTDGELAKLKAEFPGDWQQRIERLSGYIASSGKRYKNHLATIRNWARKDAEARAPAAAGASSGMVDAFWGDA